MIRRAAAGCAIGVFLVSCSPRVSSDLSPALRTELEEDLRAASSDFEREVIREALATGTITPARYQQAHQRYLDCLATKGVHEQDTRLSNGLYRVTRRTGEDADRAARQCADGTIMRIEAAYRTQLLGARGDEDAFQLAANCLVRHGVVVPGYSGERLRADLDGSPPFDPHAGAADECLYTAGIAI